MSLTHVLILCTCVCDNFDGVLMFKTHITCIPNSKRYTLGSFEVRDHTSDDAAYTHEYNVIQKHIYNKFKCGQ